MKNIVLLISGTGSNMQAIVQACHQKNWTTRYGARIAAVISNRADARGLQWAQEQGVPVATLEHKKFPSRESFDAQLQTVIDAYEPSLLVLAGFMRILTPDFVAHYEGRIVNIHPSLLPAFPGLDTHQRALDAGCQFAGATVHRVTAQLDHGEILGQVVVPVLPQDSAQSLAQRVLSQEHLLYPSVIERELQRLSFKS